MNEYIPHIPAKLIVPLNMNGMIGRMLYLPSSKKNKRRILIVYSRRSSLEQLYNFAKTLNKYGSVTVPDLPGCGGMDSFYKIGEKPTLENLADYLAALIKLRFKRGPITIIGMTYGFAVVTRMLQKYPEIAKRTDILISLNGFSHSKDLKLKDRQRQIYKLYSHILSSRWAALAFKKSLFKKFLHSGDIRTLMYTTRDILSLDNTGRKVDSELWNITTKKENTLYAKLVTPNLRLIYKKVYNASVQKHPTALTKKNIAKALPSELKRQLSKT